MFVCFKMMNRQFFLTPAAAILTLTVFAGPVQSQDTKPTIAPAVPAKDLPKAENLLEKAIDAMGGEKAFKAIKSSRTKVTMNIVMMNMSMSGERFTGKDGQFVQTMSTPMGDQTMGSDGEHTWIKDPMGYRMASDMEKEQMDGQSTMFRFDLPVMLTEDDTDEPMATVGMGELNDEETYKVRRVDDDGEAFAHFSKKSGRLLGITSVQDTPMGRMEMSMVLTDWKKFGDLMLYTKIAIKQGPQNIEITFDEIEFNKVDDSVFDLPDEIKKLLKDGGGASSQPTTRP